MPAEFQVNARRFLYYQLYATSLRLQPLPRRGRRLERLRAAQGLPPRATQARKFRHHARYCWTASSRMAISATLYEQTPVCSIIIRAYNEEEHIGRLLQGITEQTVRDVQVILVDSGSTDANRANRGKLFVLRLFHPSARIHLRTLAEPGHCTSQSRPGGDGQRACLPGLS